MIEIPWFAIFVGSYVLWVLVACASLLMSRRSPQATLAWIFAFIAFPVISGLYYMVFGPRRFLRRRRRYGVARAMAGSVSQHLRATSRREEVTLERDSRSLAAVGRRLSQGMPTLATAVRLLDDGDQCMEALEEATNQARHHIHLEYYIWEPDRIGSRFRDVLAAAAARGVEVRILFDAVGSPRLKEAFWKPLVEAGGDVRSFNPMGFSLASLHFANFRTHRKIAIIDGKAGFLGGINMHDPASATRSGKDAWRDQHVRIDGEPVRKLQRLFLENWTYSHGSFRITEASLPSYFPPADAGGEGVPVQILASGPDDENAPMLAFFLAAIATARERVWIQTPYLIPDEALESALRTAQLRDVDVQVIVPKQGDSRIVTAASRTYCDALVKAGIVVFEYGPPMLHAKTMIIDNTVAVVGTANLDNRSFRLNFEVAAAFYDHGVIDRLVTRFKEDREASSPFRLRRGGAKWTTLVESVARLTSPVL